MDQQLYTKAVWFISSLDKRYAINKGVGKCRRSLSADARRDCSNRVSGRSPASLIAHSLTHLPYLICQQGERSFLFLFLWLEEPHSEQGRDRPEQGNADKHDARCDRPALYGYRIIVAKPAVEMVTTVHQRASDAVRMLPPAGASTTRIAMLPKKIVSMTTRTADKKTLWDRCRRTIAPRSRIERTPRRTRSRRATLAARPQRRAKTDGMLERRSSQPQVRKYRSRFSAR